MPDELFTETENIPVFVDDEPRVMVMRGLEEGPARHAEFIPHTRQVTHWYSPDCPDCAEEFGVHERRRDEIRARTLEEAKCPPPGS